MSEIAQTILLSTANIPQPTEKNRSNSKMVWFGEDNNYPSYIFDSYSNSTLLQSIINRMTDYICGSGFESDGDKKVNKYGDTLEDIVKKAVLDYEIFGAFSLQVIRNVYHEIKEIYYVDVRRVRLDKSEEFIYLGRDIFNQKDCVKYKRAFTDNSAVADTDEIFYYSNPKSRGIYGLPSWHSAMKDVQTSIEISTFHLSAIQNSFVPSAIVSFNNGIPSEEQKAQLNEAFQDKFTGANNAAKLMLTFSNDKEHGVEVQRISEDNFDQRYQALSKSVTNNIFMAFSAQPVLFGLDPDRTAFNSIEYRDSFHLFKETTIAPIQREIERAFAKLSPKYSFQLKEFNIKFEENGTNTPII